MLPIGPATLLSPLRSVWPLSEISSAAGPAASPAVTVGAVQRQSVGDEGHLVVDPGGVRPCAAAAGEQPDGEQPDGESGEQSPHSRGLIHDVTSSSTRSRSGSLNTSWNSSG